jgi:glutathione S-transferase
MLCVFLQVLGESSSGFLVGESVSLADIGLLEVLFNIVDYFGEEPLLDYPNVLVSQVT